MLKLYHHGSSVCAAKVRMYMHEKNLEWEGHYLDILAGDQFDPRVYETQSKSRCPNFSA